MTATINLKYTGSDSQFPDGVEIPILFVDGDQAIDTYLEPSTGLPVVRIESPGCPYCKGPVGGTLMVNPLDGDHRYYRCPLCGTFSRWTVIGTNKDRVVLSTDWKVYATKITALDIDDDDFAGWEKD